MTGESVRSEHHRDIAGLIRVCRAVIDWSGEQSLSREDNRLFTDLINAVSKLERFEVAHPHIKDKVKHWRPDS